MMQPDNLIYKTRTQPDPVAEPGDRSATDEPVENAQPEWSAWERWADAKIAAALQNYPDLDAVAEALGTMVGDAREAAENECRALRKEIAELSATVAELKAAITKAAAARRRRGDVSEESHGARQ